MQQQDEIEQRAERANVLRSLLRLLGAIVISYYVVLSGGFAHSAATGVISSVAIVSTMASVALRWAPLPGWVVFACRVAMVISGGLLTLQTDAVGWVVFGVGAVNLLGRLEVDVIVGVLVIAAGAVPIVVGVALQGSDLRDNLFTLAATVGVGVMSYSRRLVRDRRKKDAELVERSRELEQRSLQLIDQTERTRAETARVAALEERTRIARDIHDLLAHSLGGLVVQLDAADALLASGGTADQVAERVKTSRRLAVDGLREARSAVRELRSQDGAAAVASAESSGATDPADDLSVDAVEQVIKIIRGPVGVQLGVDFDVVGDHHPVPARVATAFAAVARESLTNINKHAAGQRTVGSLIFADDGLRLELINAVATDGDKAPADDHELADTGGGFGVAGMRQRLVAVGGTLSAGRRGDRWTVSAEWPADETITGAVQASTDSE